MSPPFTCRRFTKCSDFSLIKFFSQTHCCAVNFVAKFGHSLCAYIDVAHVVCMSATSIMHVGFASTSLFISNDTIISLCSGTFDDVVLHIHQKR